VVHHTRTRDAPVELADPRMAQLAARLGEAGDIITLLDKIALVCRDALGATRATCYTHDASGRYVASVHTTEQDPRGRAVLEAAIGRSSRELPVWRLLVESEDPLLVIEDTASDPRIPAGLARRLGGRALIGARLEQEPLGARARTSLRGSLFCSYAAPRTFRAEDRQVIRGLALLAALALDNAQLRAETEQRLAEIRTLSAEQGALRRIATEVAAESEPAVVFRRTAEEAALLLGADAAVVVRFEDSEGTVVGSHGGHPEPGARLPLTGDGALAAIARTGKPHGIPHYTALSPRSPVRALALAEGYRASAAAPVRVSGQLWGALFVATRSPAGLPDGAVERLGRFAELIALAIANAQTRADLVAQATTDPLTGVANRRALLERLRTDVERAHRHGRPLSLVLMDLDGFKAVNDRHGHLAGDRALVELVGRLTPLVRAGDVLGRFGGDEFAWLLPETDSRGAAEAAERARRAVAARPFPGIGPLALSAGVAELTEGMSADDLVHAADVALYAAKPGRGGAAAAGPAAARRAPERPRPC
jgi:diguanylate cyclase (GGDEF)-like protein